MLFKSILFFYLLLFINILNAQNLSVTLTEELVIGDDENAAKEYLFFRPTQICTDSKNNIYVADYNRGEVRVFDKEGKYLKFIGKKGKGPGEILEVVSMTIDKNDDLIVVDRMNDRFTRFTDFGNNFYVYPMTVDHIIDCHEISPLGSDGYLLYHLRKSKNKSYRTTAEDRVLHVYSKDFTSILESFAKAGEICNPKDNFLLSRVGENGSHFCVLSPDTVIFVPEFYNGILFSYIKKNGSWYLRTLQGKKPNRKSYKMLNPKDFPKQNYPPHIFMNSGPLGRFLGQYQNKSLGVFSLDKRYIIHFTSVRIGKNKWIIAAELFERNGRFIGYCEVKDNLTLNFNEGDTPIFNEILWYNKGIVYGNALSKYSPVVRAARLEYKISK